MQRSCILAAEGAYSQLRARIVASQPPAAQPALSTCLDGLMRDVSRSLEPKNRDKFTQVCTGVAGALFMSIEQELKLTWLQNLTNVRQDFRRKQS